MDLEDQPWRSDVVDGFYHIVILQLRLKGTGTDSSIVVVLFPASMTTISHVYDASVEEIVMLDFGSPSCFRLELLITSSLFSVSSQRIVSTAKSLEQVMAIDESMSFLVISIPI